MVDLNGFFDPHVLSDRLVDMVLAFAGYIFHRLRREYVFLRTAATENTKGIASLAKDVYILRREAKRRGWRINEDD